MLSSFVVPHIQSHYLNHLWYHFLPLSALSYPFYHRILLDYTYSNYTIQHTLVKRFIFTSAPPFCPTIDAKSLKLFSFPKSSSYMFTMCVLFTFEPVFNLHVFGRLSLIPLSPCPLLFASKYSVHSSKQYLSSAISCLFLTLISDWQIRNFLL